jgi:hypothetical protein
MRLVLDEQTDVDLGGAQSCAEDLGPIERHGAG